MSRPQFHRSRAGATHTGSLPRIFRGAPDLAVEILVPKDRPLRLVEKLRGYFESGTRLARIINPAKCKVVVHRTLEPDRLLRVSDALDGEDVLPGFRLPRAELFAELSFE